MRRYTKDHRVLCLNRMNDLSDGNPEPSGAQARLLVVDDNEDNRYTLIMRLQLEGYKNITTADDGESALELLRTQDFDLVLLDVMMPRIDGYEVLRRLKTAGQLHDIPVIMISALNEIESVVRCIELGAIDYLAKPFDPILLRARVGACLENKRLRDEVRAHLARIEEELESARELQLGMLPTNFEKLAALSRVEIFATMEPAREVGGDLYDFFEMDDGRLCFLIGDVSGKGVASALFMARTKNVVRLIARLLRGTTGSVPTPAEIIAAVNQELCQDNSGMMFVTLFFAMLDTATGEISFVNAGHNPPYHLAGDKVVPVAEYGGRALGARGNSTYETGSLTLARGDAIFLYTDGVTEAFDRNDKMFSDERLEAVLRDVASGRPETIIGAVSGAVRAFADGAEQSDDITAAVIRRRPDARS
jgi:sigma-B regulation protein RsbU (phosphoserine phosphatase)